MLYYVFSIKQRLLTAFYPQTDSKTKWQNSIIEAYLQVFVNFEQNNLGKLLPIVKFAYNNAKNACTGPISFELNYSYHLQISYKENINLRSKSKSINKLSVKLKEVMIICWKNLYCIKKLQKLAHNKGIKPKSYTLENKFWLNSKYIKTKQNRKLKAKFLQFFKVLHPVKR